MFDKVVEEIKEIKEKLRRKKIHGSYIQIQLSQLKNPTDKDILVAVFLDGKNAKSGLDVKSRIVPAIFFQPHFSNMHYEIRYNEHTKKSVLFSEEYNAVKESPIFQGFKYIKTFTPMRRITTSYGATVRFMLEYKKNREYGQFLGDVLSERLLNRSFLIDVLDRLYRDSVLVRFEDGKLNPKATFTALAQFLDIPYTESMTYCSGSSGINPESLQGNDRGFDPAAIYRTYDEYVDDADRTLLEFFMRDAYKYYGYDFCYYHGEEVNGNWIKEKLSQVFKLNSKMTESFQNAIRVDVKRDDGTVIDNVDAACAMAEERAIRVEKNRINIALTLLRGLNFVNQSGQPLHFMKKLELDPDLLEQPLYH